MRPLYEYKWISWLIAQFWFSLTYVGTRCLQEGNQSPYRLRDDLFLAFSEMEPNA